MGRRIAVTHRALPVVAVAVVLIAAGCAGKRPTTATLPAGQRAVTRIELVGVRAFAHADVLAGLATEQARRDGLPFERAQVREDRRRVLARYVRAGYWSAEVDSEVDDDSGQVRVRFTVVEGPRARLAAVDISGLPAELTRDDVRGAIDLADGAPFDYTKYDRAKPALIALLDRHGYAHGRVDAWVDADRAAGQATVRLRFEPGPRTRLGAVTINGVDGDLRDAVRARLALRPGEPYSSQALVAAQASVVELGRFTSVRVEPDRSVAATEVPVVVTVTRAPPNELRGGGGIGIDPATYQLRARGGYTRAGFPDALTTARFEVRPALVRVRATDDNEPRVEATVGLDRADLWRPRVRGEIEAGFTYETLEAYTSVGPRLRVGLRSPIGSPSVSVAIGWQLRVLDFPQVDPAIDDTPLEHALGLDEAYRLGAYTQALIVDLRDDPVAPRWGAYGELRVEEGNRWAGGAFQYVKMVPELRGYLPVGPVVLAARARAGAIVGKVPVTQRLFAGGAYSQRGFPERRLAPTATAVVAGEPHATPYGGGALVETGVEARTHLFTIKKVRFDGAVFLDGADVAEDLGALDVTDLHWATGGGIRVPTPIGAVRIDVGVRLNRLGAGELRPGERFAYHLGIGEAF